MAEPRTAHQVGATRRARTDAKLADVVVRLLAEHGYAGLTSERVAAESGVAKTTIYRRWASKAEMVFDLAIHRAPMEPLRDTGTLYGDIRGLAQRVAHLMAGQPGRTVLPGLILDMTDDPELTRRIRNGFFVDSQPEIAAILDRAVIRGELGNADNLSDLHAAVLGIAFAQVHLLGHLDPTTLTETLTDHMMRLLAVNR